MLTFRVPLGVCKDLDAMTKKFWWNSKGKQGMALKAWNDICWPKELGGLSFRLFHEMNLAFLAKLAWKMATDEDSL